MPAPQVPASPGIIPNPAALRALASVASWEEVYLAGVATGHGCGGSEVEAQLLLSKPWSYAELGAARTAVSRAASAAATAADAVVEAQLRAELGPRPRWEAGSLLTRSEFEHLDRQWSARAAALRTTQEAFDLAACWESEGAALVDVEHLVAVNSGYEEAGLGMLVAYQERGCLCGHGGGSYEDPEYYEGEELPSHGFLTPRAALLRAGGLSLLAASERELEDPGDVLVELSERWEAERTSHAERLAEERAALAALPSEESMAEMRYEEWQAAKLLHQQMQRRSWQLRGLERTHPGEHLRAGARRLELHLLVAGFAERDSYGWRRGQFATVAAELMGEVGGNPNSAG